MFTTGPAGSGKSLFRCARFLCVEFLPGGQGRHISNFPIKFDPWTDGLGKEQPGLVAMMAEKGLEETEVRQRVKLIEPEEINAWRNVHLKKGQKPCGPWDYFEGYDLSGVHIAIDEIHNFCGASSPQEVVKKWQEWLGELRHRGATIEFLTQHPNKCAQAIRNEAEIKLEVVPEENRTDGFIGIKKYYWFNLKAKLGYGWAPRAFLVESRQVMGKFRIEDEKAIEYDSAWFGCYDSFSGPVAGGRSGSTGQREWETKSLPALLWWIFRDNSYRIVSRVGFFSLVLCCMVFGKQVFALYLWFFMSVGRAPKPKDVAAANKPPSSAAAAAVELKPEEGRAGEAMQTIPQAARDEYYRVADQALLLQEENINLRSRLEELTSRIEEAFAVASVTRDSVTFRAGYTYRVGETIDFGPFQGRQVKGIEYVRRSVLLSDGRVLRMGVSGQSSPVAWLQGEQGTPTDAVLPSPSDLREPLRGAAGDDVASRAGSHRGETNQHQHQRNAARRVPALADERDRSILRR